MKASVAYELLAIQPNESNLKLCYYNVKYDQHKHALQYQIKKDQALSRRQSAKDEFLLGCTVSKKLHVHVFAGNKRCKHNRYGSNRAQKCQKMKSILRFRRLECWPHNEWQKFSAERITDTDDATGTTDATQCETQIERLVRLQHAFLSIDGQFGRPMHEARRARYSIRMMYIVCAPHSPQLDCDAPDLS